MAKWISPRERETAKLVAQYRPVAQQATAELTADWTAVPDGASNLIFKAVRHALIDAGLDVHGDANYAAIGTLQDECAKPFVAKWQQQREAKKAAETAVDVNRPAVARCEGAHRVGELVILRDGDTERVLVCIGTGRSFDDERGDTEWYSDLAEPNETETASADYQRMHTQVVAANSQRAEARRQQEARREADLHAIRNEGREPTDFEDMFAGTSDD